MEPTEPIHDFLSLESLPQDQIELEHRTWLELNSKALEVHGEDIAMTGLAGDEFDRI